MYEAIQTTDSLLIPAEMISDTASLGLGLTDSFGSSQQAMLDDERYPGSFFRVPGVPAPGKTTWSLT